MNLAQLSGCALVGPDQQTPKELERLLDFARLLPETPRPVIVVSAHT